MAAALPQGAFMVGCPRSGPTPVQWWPPALSTVQLGGAGQAGLQAQQPARALVLPQHALPVLAGQAHVVVGPQPMAVPAPALTAGQPPYQPIPAAGQVMVASYVFDGERREIRYGVGQEFESPADFFSPCHSEWREPYQAMLDDLDSTGWLEGLPVDSQGILRVSMPFCGSNQELPVLVEFLAARFLGKHGVNGIHIVGSDVVNWNVKGGYWHQKEKWVARKFPGMQLQFRQMDLAREQHPESALTLGIHPECTVPGPWPEILTNILRSTTGVCLVATFKDAEMQVVRDLCQRLGLACEVHENPFWQSRPLPPGTVPPFLRFLVLVRSSGATGAGPR